MRGQLLLPPVLYKSYYFSKLILREKKSKKEELIDKIPSLIQPKQFEAKDELKIFK